MQIYEALKKDHVEVKGLLNQLINLDDSATDKRNALVTKIRDALIPHSRAEEAVFYNSLRSVNTEKTEVMHGYAEHLAAEGLLRTLQLEDKINVGWKTTAKTLKKALEHHIQEEETTLFDAAKKVFTDVEAEQIGKAFEALKPKIKEENVLQTTLDMMKNLMPQRFASALKASGTSKSH